MESKTLEFIATKYDANARLDVVITKRIKHLTRSNLK